MENNVQSQIVKFNRLFKSYDDIYCTAARKFDMPMLSLWIIYVVRGNEICTQKDLVEQLYHPKQSINSALRSLEKDGYVVLEPLDNDHRCKRICLTEKGTTLAVNTADKIIDAERLAFSSLADSEREMFLNLFERLSSELDKEMQNIK